MALSQWKRGDLPRVGDRGLTPESHPLPHTRAVEKLVENLG